MARFPALTAKRRALTAILVLCFIGRVAFMTVFGDTLSLETSGYDAYAVNLLAGHGYTRFDDLRPDSDLPPLYAFFLAGVYAAFGRDAHAVAAVQVLFDLLTVTLVFLIGRRVFNARVGLLAAALTALYPYMLFQNLTVNDTALFTCLLALAVYLSYRALDGANRGEATARRAPTRSLGATQWAALTGAVIGVAALSKTFALLLVPLLGLWLTLRAARVRRLGWRRGLLLLAVSGVAAALVIAPWVARNVALHGQFVLISTNGGSNLHQGNNPCTAPYLRAGWDAQWTGHCWNPPPQGLTEVEMDRWHTEQALAFLVADVGRALDLFWVKLLALWSPTITPAAAPPELANELGLVLQYEGPAFQAARVVHLLYFGPLLALGGAGLIGALRARAAVFPLIAVFGVMTFTYVVYHPSTRYRMPLDPLLFILSAYALDRLWREAAARRAASRRRRKASA